MNLEGRLLGNRYEIIEKIGNGGMATVYKAKCHVLNRFVAVKVLKEEFTTDEEFIKRFNTEAQAAASLTHPNIVSIYDVGNEGNLYYIVMELIQGKTLKQIIVEDGTLSWKWSVNVAIQIASALETAHRNGIVHRDIKPHNIIITEEGVAKVTDFGIAKAVSNSTITAFGTTIGSVHYFSPEHARGGFTDAKSDLYSLGVVLYEMLTGKVPFDADTPVSVALMHMQETAIEPIKLNTGIPESVNKIVMKAMRKDSNLRYQSATEMLKDLNMALKNPNGNFVVMQDEGMNSPTQRIPTINDVPIKEEEEHNRRKEDNGKFKWFKKHKIMTFFMGAVLLFILTIGITYGALKMTAVKDIPIPNVVGLSQDEAKKQIEEKKLVYQEEEPEYSPDVPEGYVISQTPAYRESGTVKEKAVIKVVISKGQELTTVPKVVGMQKNEAISELEKANLKAEVIEETSKTVQEGYVISQETEEKTEVNAGETVKIHVSIGTGIKQVSVPYVVTKTEEDARKTLTDSGLKVKEVIYQEDKTKDDGKVIKQDIEAGSTVDEGTEITLVVNKIPQIKNGTVIVNVRSIQGYEEPEKTTNTNNNTTNSTNNTTTGNTSSTTNTPASPRQVTLKLTVNGERVEEKKVSEASKNERITVQGIGTVEVKVYINDNLKRTVQFNLNEKDSITIE